MKSIAYGIVLVRAALGILRVPVKVSAIYDDSAKMCIASWRADATETGNCPSDPRSLHTGRLY